MQLNYPEEEKRFADEVRAFVRAELPREIFNKVLEHRLLTRDEMVFWQRKLVERGYATPNWPSQYGGPGWSSLRRHVYDITMAAEGAPPAIPFGESMIAPVLFAVGTQEQKAHYLPRIRTLECFFCQGFSEPSSGSDLASLKTKAVLDGEEWVINGQKMWTTFAHLANTMFCLVRTDPDAKSQEGISMLVFPMSTPGITVRPIVTLDGAHHTNEVFFDDVRVPASSLIGEVNKGWNYAKLLLSHERTSIAGIGPSKRDLERLKRHSQRAAPDGTSLFDNPSFRAKLASAEVELLALELTALRAIESEGAGRFEGLVANLLKIRGSEIQQRLTELSIEAIGPYGLPFFSEEALVRQEASVLIGSEEDVTMLMPHYLMTRVVSIYGGSNEIQRSIVAKSLGL